MSPILANVRYIAACHVVCCFILGCADTQPTTRPATAEEQANKILREAKENDHEAVDISGGKIGEFNKRAMQRDLDRVLNP